jgi:serine/threonine-protein kinase RsbW
MKGRQLWGGDQHNINETERSHNDGVSIAVKDEGRGFDTNNVPDPTAPDNLESVHGRGIHMMKALMDEVCFEEGGVVLRMKKHGSKAPH